MDIDDELIVLGSAALDEDDSGAANASKRELVLGAVLVSLCVIGAVLYHAADRRVEHLPAAFSTKAEKQNLELRRSLDEISQHFKTLAR